MKTGRPEGRLPGPRTRGRAALLLLSFVLSQLLSFAHFAAVSHERCAEHGELIHATAHADPLTILPTDAETRLVKSDHPSSHDEHCQLNLCPPPALQWVAQVVINVQSCPWSAPQPPPAGQLISGRSLYQLAPKTGPPQLA